MPEIEILVREPTPAQWPIKSSTAKRKIVKAGRRFGKTTLAAQISVEDKFMKGKRVTYGAPTIEQVDTYWAEVCRALQPLIDAKVLKRNETTRTIEVAEPYIKELGSDRRIHAKTCWNPDTLRGGWSDFLILEEFQLMNEQTWTDAGQPMLLDKDGDALFIFTPPSLKSAGVSKADDPRHASKLFKQHLNDTDGRWECFHGTSFDNPTLSQTALDEICNDMSLDSYRREILAEDDEIEASWLVYGCFDERACKIKSFPIPDTWPVYTFHDFGRVNHAALFVAQNPGTAELVIFAEYAPATAYTYDQRIADYKEILKKHTVIKSIGGNHAEQEIRMGYGKAGWPIMEPVIHEVNAQIDRVKNLMEHNRILIFETCHGLLSQIANAMWKLDDNKPLNKIDREASYHFLAGLRYGCTAFRPELITNKTTTHVKRYW
jgi:hypothetical protein